MTVSKDHVYEDKEKTILDASVQKPEGMSILIFMLFKFKIRNVIFLTLKHCHKL